MFSGLDFPGSTVKTREVLGWNPIGPGLIADLDAMHYANRVPAGLALKIA
jgi:hypothetical protein